MTRRNSDARKCERCGASRKRLTGTYCRHCKRMGVNEVAARLQRRRRYVFELLHSGALKVYRRDRKYNLILRSDVEALLRGEKPYRG